MQPNTFTTAAVILLSGVLSLSSGGTFAAAPARHSSAGSPTPSVAELLELAQAAKGQFQPLPANHVPQAKARVQAAAGKLERALNRSGATNAKRWKEYLGWDAMRAELAKSDGPDLRQLGSVTNRLIQNYGSLELPVFTNLRDSLVDYINAIAMAGDGQLAQNYASQLDRLVELLPTFDQAPTTELGQQIGQAIGWLENAGQASELVAAVRRRYWQPNLYAEVSERLVSDGVTTEVDDDTEVRDCILGTSIVGRARMRGATTGRLVEDPHSANIQLVLSGTATSSNVGFNRGVTIHSHATTQVDATKSVYISPEGLNSTGAGATCATQSAIDGISAKSCLIERIAWKRAARSKGTAEQIASQHAEQRVAEQMDLRADKLLAETKSSFQEKFRKPLLRRGEFPQDLRFQTAQGVLRVIWRQASASQLAAPTVPPPVEGHPDLAVRVHESMVSNFSRAMIGGVTLTDKRLVEILEEGEGEVPEALKISDDKEPWSITFASNEPVNAVFADDTIRFAIRGRRFALGDRVVGNTLEMSAVYKLEKTPEGAKFTRQGDVSVEYIKLQGQLGLDQIAVRTVMREKFEALFAPEFNTTGLKLPGRWENTGKLHLERLISRDGWLSLAWLRAAVGQAVAQSN